MTDKAFVLDQLRRYPDGRDAVQIISASFRERDCGVGAVHSRISELREDGFGIPPAVVEGRTRRGWPRYVYRLVSEPCGAATGSLEPGPVAVEPSAGAVMVGTSDGEVSPASTSGAPALGEQLALALESLTGAVCDLERELGATR